MGYQWKNESKLDWGTLDDTRATREEIKIGAIQRIADATEIMSKRYSDLLAEVERYKQRYSDSERLVESLQRAVNWYRKNWKKRKATP